MFGYITINKGELKVKEYEKYKAYYCGLCSALKEKYGMLGQVTLTYDMTFLVLVLSSLYEDKEQVYNERCVVRSFKKHSVICNEFSEYGADMNMLLTYYKLLDDWEDDRDYKALIMAALIRKKCSKAVKKNPRQAKAIKQYIVENKACENSKERDFDKVAGCTGRMLAELFDYKGDEWSQYLRSMGFYLGKFIYLMDAYDDMEEDMKTGNYNPMKQLAHKPDKDKQIQDMLGMMAASATAWFEKLPILINAEILRNILYSGMWSAYNKKMNRTKEERNGTCSKACGKDIACERSL